MGKRIVAAAALLVLLCAGARAQSGPKSEAAPAPSAEQQKAVAEAVRGVEEARKDLETAQARLEAAEARAQAALYRVMAALKLDPDEWRAVVKEGKLTFERIPRP